MLLYPSYLYLHMLEFDEAIYIFYCNTTRLVGRVFFPVQWSDRYHIQISIHLKNTNVNMISPLFDSYPIRFRPNYAYIWRVAVDGTWTMHVYLDRPHRPLLPGCMHTCRCWLVLEACDASPSTQTGLALAAAATLRLFVFLACLHSTY